MVFCRIWGALTSCNESPPGRPGANKRFCANGFVCAAENIARWWSRFGLGWPAIKGTAEAEAGAEAEEPIKGTGTALDPMVL